MKYAVPIPALIRKIAVAKTDEESKKWEQVLGDLYFQQARTFSDQWVEQICSKLTPEDSIEFRSVLLPIEESALVQPTGKPFVPKIVQGN